MDDGIADPALPRGRDGRLTLALAGDTMLGRGVAARLESAPAETLFAPELVRVTNEADLFVLNLECCISNRGERWPDPAKPFFFRAPPAAVDVLTLLGVDCVTLANNHALDYGPDALLDTIVYLREAGVAVVGAGADLEEARRPCVLESSGFRLAVVGATNHPAVYEAGATAPGVALANLDRGAPGWLLEVVQGVEADAVLVTPHWGPNMTTRPLRSIRSAAADLIAAGATLIAGHSAHVFHGVEGPVLYDLGDLIDDYARDPVRRNDLGLLVVVTLDRDGPIRLEALPLRLEYAYTGPAGGDDAAWVRRRFVEACADLGTRVSELEGRLVVDWRAAAGAKAQDRSS